MSETDKKRLPASTEHWKAPLDAEPEAIRPDISVPMGWGRLHFGQTFLEAATLAERLAGERRGERDIALYVRDPHVVLALAPDALFLDPSHTMRLDQARYRPAKGRRDDLLAVRLVASAEDAAGVQRVQQTAGMVPSPPPFVLGTRGKGPLRFFVAVDESSGRVVGTVTGVDHREAFGDPEEGSSLWCLAVDPQCALPGVGQALVRALVEDAFGRGRSYVDLSVMHDNEPAIALYEKLGFARVPVFCVKRRNPINEPLYVADPADEGLNPYATLITREARRRGIRVEVLDAEEGYFRLHRGGRVVTCRESLSELTSAIAFSRCDDKRITHRVLASAGLPLPEQLAASRPEDLGPLLARHGEIVVKPARGEQGRGITVGVRRPEELEAAFERAERVSAQVLGEELVPGQDLRVIVIGQEVVAAAIRRPAQIVGDGERDVRTLIERANRRRMAATGGESRIPLDEETERVVTSFGRSFDEVLPAGETLLVRKSANLHTGGTIHDVTAELSEPIRVACLDAARALEIPVVGLDLIVDDPGSERFVFIEANERPGLANHEPQPTAERFVDLLFPPQEALTLRGGEEEDA